MRNRKIALILVDIQNDFCTGGSLAIPDGEAVVGPANALIEHAGRQGWPVFLTRDWHPPNHVSFQAAGGPWPPHCVANTDGARFHPELKIPRDAVIVSKATSQNSDAYSGFEGTDLNVHLEADGAEQLIIAGLATEYCVKNTVLDGLEAGYSVDVVREGIRAVNVEPDDEQKALNEMKRSGARIATLSDATSRE